MTLIIVCCVGICLVVLGELMKEMIGVSGKELVLMFLCDHD